GQDAVPVPVRKEKGRLLQKRNEQQGMSKKQTMQGGNGCKKIKTCRTRGVSATQFDSDESDVLGFDLS
ncbi:MAG: hypothetical protein FWE95_11435, partial [Planctomycetaceae bacterium]|nr:hypothetical protein [Planctomycetaceae bacterium]